jgi:glycosyltransferase involved in cell wall biosynthesis
MACGCPVAVAKGSALDEYAGEAGLVFDPGDQASIAGAVRTLLGDEAVRLRLRDAGLERARKFSWQRTAEAIEVAAGIRRPPGSP